MTFENIKKIFKSLIFIIEIIRVIFNRVYRYFQIVNFEAIDSFIRIIDELLNIFISKLHFI